MCSIIVCKIDNIRYFSDGMLVSLDKSDACMQTEVDCCLYGNIRPPFYFCPFRPHSQQVTGQIPMSHIIFLKTQRTKITLGKK